MTKQTDRGTGFSPKRIEEVARTHDAIQRARAAAPISGGSDRLSGLKSFLGRQSL
jgi:hypothetical protein